MRERLYSNIFYGQVRKTKREGLVYYIKLYDNVYACVQLIATKLTSECVDLQGS